MTTSAPTDLAGALQDLGPDELTHRRVEARRLLRDDGVTYNVTRGPDPGTRAWEMDPLPVVVTSDQWAPIDHGLAQRARVLDLLLADLYGPRRLLREGLLPPEVVFAHPGFLRECDQTRLPGEHQLLLTAADVGRDESGRHVVLADRTQAPSGAGYALENRIVVSRVFASLYRGAGVHRLAPFFRTLRTALQSVVPAAVDQPRIVVLTPGPWSETAFEHAFTASYLGFPLVQGTDLQVRDGRVWMRTLGRPEPVHVILRRLDAEFCDPLELRPDSKLGVPGLVEASRLGNVSVVNALGSGVLENPALLPFLPSICDALLGEPMRLPSVDTWWCGDDTSRQHVLAQLDRLVLKRVPSGNGTALLMGAQLDQAARDELRRRIESEPHAWVGQEAVQLSSVPTSTDSGIELRRSVLRTFTVADGDGFAVLPGGLTLVAGQPDDRVISNQTGAISKDTWVLAEEPESLTDFWLRSGPVLDAVEPVASMSSRAAENLFWLSRYAERAEGLVRLLRVVEDRRTEFSHRPLDGGAGDACVAVLLGALAATTGAPVVDSLPPLVVDVELPGSLAYSVRRMLDAATEVRDQLSIDTWLVIGGLDRALRAPGLDGSLDSASPALARVMQGLLALAGLSAESLVRDPGWHFLEAGRRIERAVHMCSLLTATVDERRGTATDSLVLESVLTASESIITYRRRYRSQAQLQTVLDLLLLDDHNPRSLLYQVEHLVDAVGSLPVVGTGRSDAERLALGLAAVVHEVDTAHLARSQEDRARPALREFLEETTRALAAIAGSIESDHFTPELPQQAVFTPFTPNSPNHPSRGVPLAEAAGERQRDGPRGEPVTTTVDDTVITYRVVHRTEYQYAAEVSSSYGEVHLQPRDTPAQRCYMAAVSIDPFPEHYRERRDFHGNRVGHYAILEPHSRLLVTGTSEVGVGTREDPRETLDDLPWETVRDALRADRSADGVAAREVALPSPAVGPSLAAGAFATESFTTGRPMLGALEDLVSRVHREFEYAPGLTTVSTTLDEVLERRVGVCQDFAHLTIAGLRAHGLAARYVSGYLETDPPEGVPRLQGADVSHAWLSVFLPGWGWVDVDPTNDQFVNERYVTAAWGRDYGDVPPLKGVIFTEGDAHELLVTVDVMRIDDPGSQVPSS